MPLAWAILLTMAAFVAAELVMRQLAGNSEHRISPIQNDPDQASLGSSWKRFSFIPLFLVHGVLVAAGHDWPGTVTPVLASILGVLLALMPLVSAWSGDLPALLGCVTAFTLWAVAAFTAGPGLTTLVGGVLIAALAGAARLRARSSPSHPADERASNDGPGHDGDDAQQRGGDE